MGGPRGVNHKKTTEAEIHKIPKNRKQKRGWCTALATRGRNNGDVKTTGDKPKSIGGRKVDTAAQPFVIKLKSETIITFCGADPILSLISFNQRYQQFKKRKKGRNHGGVYTKRVGGKEFFETNFDTPKEWPESTKKTLT